MTMQNQYRLELDHLFLRLEGINNKQKTWLNNMLYWGAKNKYQTTQSLLFKEGDSYYTLKGIGQFLYRQGVFKQWPSDAKADVWTIPDPKVTPAITLRDYQMKTLGKCLQYKSGACELGTGAGKSLIIAAFLKNLLFHDDNATATLVVPSIYIGYQLKKDLLDVGIPPEFIGFLGGGERDAGNIRILVTVVNSLAKEISNTFFYKIKADSISLRDMQFPDREVLPELPGNFYLNFLRNSKALIFDECFGPETLIDTPTGQIPIENIKIGDLVYNAKGIGFVTATSKKQILDSRAEVTFSDKTVICSLEHPFLTSQGWVYAKDLIKGDILVQYTESHKDKSLYDVPEYVFSKDERKRAKTKILLAPMSSPKSWVTEEELPTNEEKQSYVQKREQRESVKNFKNHGVQTKGSRGEWTSANKTRTSYNGKLNRLKMELCDKFKTTTRRLSNLLQGRFSLPIFKISNRGRWDFSLFSSSQRTRQEKRKQTKRVRVESVKILQSGSYKGNPEGHYYDLEVSGHPSFSVNGVVVHNCHHVKATIYFMIASFARPKHLLGFSGSLFEDQINPLSNYEDAVLLGLFGPPLVNISQKYLRERGFLSEPLVLKERNYLPSMATFPKMYSKVEDKYIVNNADRNKRIITAAKRFVTHGIPTLILCKRKDHATKLLESFHDIPSIVIFGNSEAYCLDEHGKTHSYKLDFGTFKDDFSNNKYKIVIASTVLDEGINLPEIGAVILAGAGKSRRKLVQRIGRCLRVKKKSKYTFIVDFTDRTHVFLNAQSKKRMSMYEEMDIPVYEDKKFFWDAIQNEFN